MKSIYKITLTIFVFLVFGTANAFAATAPTFDNAPATNITTTSATLNGSFQANGASTTNIRFEYGTTPLLGSVTPYTPYTTASGTVNVSITGLTPGTQYFFRIMGNTTSGVAFAQTVFNFTTTAVVTPSVMTTPATAVSQTTATMNGYFDTNGLDSQVWFEYGTDAALSTPVWTTKTSESAGTNGSFSIPVTGLSMNTKYYFRAVGQNTAGVKRATTVLSFTTNSAATSPCSVTGFTADSASVPSGSTTILHWTTSNCTTGTIDNGVGTVAPVASGSITTPIITNTTTFTLTAHDTAGNNSNGTVTVGVNGTGGSNCAITSFSAAAWTVSYSSNATLYWNTTGNCVNSIDNSIGNVGAYGTVLTSPLYTTTTFTLSARDTATNITQTRQIIIGVTNNGNTTSSCSITSFNSGLSAVTNGGSTTLSWSTYGCDHTSLSSSNGYYANQYQPTSGTLSTGNLSGTTTFTLYAYGNSSTQQSITVNVIGGQYSYTYACSDGVDNDGDGLIDYPADPGCISPYDNDEYNASSSYNNYNYNYNYNSNYTQTGGSETAITTMPTNVGATSARLNGLLTNVTTLFTATFEYGTTDSLGSMTGWQNLNPTAYTDVYTTIQTVPNTTYYYRIVGQFGSRMVRGSIMSFTTAASDTTTYASGSSDNTSGGSNTSSGSMAATGVTLKLSNKADIVHVDDTIEYQIDYANNTNKAIKDATITIVLPQGFTVKQTTQGVMLNPTSVSIPVGTLAAGQTGTVYMQATVDKSVATSETLVTNGTLAYTLPNGTHDSAVGYVLNHAQSQTIFAGFTLGSGFFPTTIFGWFITIIIILIIILIARRIARTNTGGGHGAHH